jgi:diguanylate cyclase (GGDEF)-like protein
MGRAITTRTIQLVSVGIEGADAHGSAGGIVEVVIPITADSTVVGVLSVTSSGACLPPSSGAALAPLASRLGELVLASQHGLESDVADLARLCVQASSLRGVDTIAEFATRTIARILRLSSAQLDLWRGDHSNPRLVSFWRRHDIDIGPLSPTFLIRLEQSTDVRVASSVVASNQLGLDDDETESVVALPLRVAGEPVGLLAGRLSGLAPTKDRLEAATLFAQHIAALIDVATTLRREQRAAVTDQLTGLLNRRGFDERFQEELVRRTHDDQPLSVVLCDCDGLKIVNDARGHEMGDALLELVASCLRTHKRAADVAARLGGDEFALLLPDADLETAFAVADRIRGAITAETLGAFRPSASFGVATFPLHGRTSADLMKTADEALYRAKQRGGDDIFAFSE